MSVFLFLLNTVETPKHIAFPPKGHDVRVVDQYAFKDSDLVGVDGLLLSQHLDERHLGENGGSLSTFLYSGGVISLNGPVARPFLDPPGAYYPLPTRSARDWVLDIVADHPVTAGVRAEDITARRGVIGFWARGYFEAPADATVLTRFASSQKPADWLWEPARGGAVLVHPGNDIWGYAGDETSASAFFPQFLDWAGSR